ncbi:hypothetical protein [Nitrosopumilus sp.]|uniref:hypothetical protein n=1 Tax=Nitrosopumilus sp. TaxID=2024843 RepID=UPI0029310995|nr:hypothetical protein [Nitrosopumilus sp.]
MNNTKKLASTTFVAAVAVLVVATISPYFYDTVIDEAIPTVSAALPQGQFVGDGYYETQNLWNQFDYGYLWRV